MKLYKLIIFNKLDNSFRSELIYSKSSSHARETFEHLIKSSEEIITIYPKNNEN